MIAIVAIATMNGFARMNAAAVGGIGGLAAAADDSADSFRGTAMVMYVCMCGCTADVDMYLPFTPARHTTVTDPYHRTIAGKEALRDPRYMTLDEP